jgi:hypothetical protein
MAAVFRYATDYYTRVFEFEWRCADARFQTLWSQPPTHPGQSPPVRITCRLQTLQCAQGQGEA